MKTKEIIDKINTVIGSVSTTLAWIEEALRRGQVSHIKAYAEKLRSEAKTMLEIADASEALVEADFASQVTSRYEKKADFKFYGDE